MLIVGGVNYFLWSEGYQGKCEFVSVRKDRTSRLERDLSEYDILIRNNESVELLHRVAQSSDKMMEEIVATRNPFGIPSNFRGIEKPDSEHIVTLYCTEKSNSTVETFICPSDVGRAFDLISKYKVIIGRAVPRGGEVGVDPSVGYRAITTVQVLYPNAVCTDTYLLLAAFDTETEAVNFAKYMTLRFPRFLLHETYSSMNITKSSFRFVPYLDYSGEWTDQKLYERYQCTEEEIRMIESLMRPLEYILHTPDGDMKKSVY